MTEEASIWPERRRTQGALFAVGGLLLSVVALALAGVVQLGGAYVVMIGTVASWILIYALLGWGGQWVAAAEADDDAMATEDGTGGEGEAEDADDAGDAPPDAVEADDDAADAPADAGR